MRETTISWFERLQGALRIPTNITTAFYMLKNGNGEQTVTRKVSHTGVGRVTVIT